MLRLAVPQQATELASAQSCQITQHGAIALTKKESSGGLTTYTWDYENKITNAILPAGIRSTFSYDADGKRVKKEDSGGTSKFLWDLENILLETNAADVTQVIYSLEPDLYGNLVSQRRNGTTSYFQFDALGSTDRLTDAVGNVTDSYVYSAFGEIKASAGSTAIPFKYAGRLGYYVTLDLGLHTVRARHYDPSVGRFLSRDAVLVMKSLYGYVNNRPTALVDPSGRQIIETLAPTGTATGTGTGIGALLASVAVTLLIAFAIAIPLSILVDVLIDPKPPIWPWDWFPKPPNPPKKPRPVCCIGKDGGQFETWCVSDAVTCCATALGPAFAAALEGFCTKKKKWKGSAKARGTCPPGCGIFKAEGDSKEECETNAWNACVAAGCHTPGGTPYNCQCGHVHCVPTS